LSCPSESGARIAVNTQNILREEAHLTDVIDPLGGSFYVEKRTDEMQAEVERTMRIVDDAGGMVRAVESGLVQTMISESPRRIQHGVESDEQTVVAVNAFQVDEDCSARTTNARPDSQAMLAHVEAFRAFKAQRSQADVASALTVRARAANAQHEIIFAQVVAAAEAGCTHGEICATLRPELGFGHVQAIV